MRVSALSLNKKQSSTYTKYACGCFLYAPSIYIVYFKRLTVNGISEPPRMAVVPRSSVFALQTRRYKMYRDVHFVPCLRLIFARALYLRRLFQKADGKWYFFRSGTDAAGSKQQSVCLQTGSPKMYTDVHFWARMSVVPRNGDVFAPQKLAINASMDGRGTNQQRVLCTHKIRLFLTYTDVCREKVYTDVHFRTGYFKRLTAEIFQNRHPWRYRCTKFVVCRLFSKVRPCTSLDTRLTIGYLGRFLEDFSLPCFFLLCSV